MMNDKQIIMSTVTQKTSGTAVILNTPAILCVCGLSRC